MESELLIVSNAIVNHVTGSSVSDTTFDYWRDYQLPAINGQGTHQVINNGFLYRSDDDGTTITYNVNGAERRFQVTYRLLASASLDGQTYDWNIRKNNTVMVTNTETTLTGLQISPDDRYSFQIPKPNQGNRFSELLLSTEVDLTHGDFLRLIVRRDLGENLSGMHGNNTGQASTLQAFRWFIHFKEIGPA